MLSCGIYSLEVRTCGCNVRHYHGGRTLIIGCAIHKTQSKFNCPICNKALPSKNKLKKHRWSHAI